MNDAACKDVDPELFFPEKGQSQRGNDAILTCFSCPVRSDCRDYRQRTNTNYGIWAGEYTKRVTSDPSQPIG